jgi:hypothetical protein
MFGFSWLFSGRTLEQRYAELEAENHRLQMEKHQLQNEIDAWKARSSPSFDAVAKDFEMGPKMYEGVVDRFYKEMRPVLSDAAFSLLMRVRMHENVPKVRHTVAREVPTRGIRMTYHRFDIPEYHTTIQYGDFG